MARPTTTLSSQIPADVLTPAVEKLIAELHLPTEFSPQVLAAADQAAQAPELAGHADLTDVEFVTIDPPGATDLDQAMHLSALDGGGYRVHYAIADVPAFVAPGSPVDAEARRRGQTMYAPNRRLPLHPPVLSEGAASLLPGQDRPAFVWVIDLDSGGQTTAVDVVRAMVRSRAQLTYEQVQQSHDDGSPAAPVALLLTIGRLLIEQERARGGSALAIPDQEVVRDDDGRYSLRYRPLLEVEECNAQISLLTGMSAADLMLGAQIGILRTLPPPDDRTLSTFRRRAAALGRPWPAHQQYGEFLRTLDPAKPADLALLHASAKLFRGAGYTPFDGDVPEQVEQAAVANEYAHVTAPLRRLVDRFGLVICESICRGRDVPGWVRAGLADLPAAMAESDHRAGALDRACVDLAEALLLSSRVGETFDGIIVDAGPSGQGTKGQVQVLDPAVLAAVSADGPLVLGAAVRVRLNLADPVKRIVAFSVVP